MRGQIEEGMWGGANKIKAPQKPCDLVLEKVSKICTYKRKLNIVTMY